MTQEERDFENLKSAIKAVLSGPMSSAEVPLKFNDQMFRAKVYKYGVNILRVDLKQDKKAAIREFVEGA